MARRIWDDNGLDVPETFFDDLRHYLGESFSVYLDMSYCLHCSFLEHEVAFVRLSSALSLAEATEHWPQSIQKVLVELESLYREKVSYRLNR